MAKDFSKYNDDNPVMAILAKAKKEEAAQSNSMAILQNIAKEEAPVEKENPVRMSVTIRMSNGVLVKRKDLSYDGLQKFVENLEGLC